MAEQVRTRLTAAEFWQLAETSDERMELLKGEVIIRATPIPVHQDAVGSTYIVVKALIKELGGRAFVAPLEVHLSDEDIPQPDVMALLPDSQCVVGEKRLEGAPDLIVEVLSPSTLMYDKDVKFKLYEQYGVREYWIADPERLNVEVWTLREGRYALYGIFILGQSFASPLLENKTVEVSALFAS